MTLGKKNQVLCSKEHTFLCVKNSFLAQVDTLTPHENTDGKCLQFIYAGIFL